MREYKGEVGKSVGVRERVGNPKTYTIVRYVLEKPFNPLDLYALYNSI